MTEESENPEVSSLASTLASRLAKRSSSHTEQNLMALAARLPTGEALLQDYAQFKAENSAALRRSWNVAVLDEPIIKGAYLALKLDGTKVEDYGK